MNRQDQIRLTGSLRIKGYNAMGAVVHDEQIDNLVTLAGRNLMRDLLGGTGGDALSHMAVGTGATAAAAGDTALEAEVERLAFTTVTSNDGQLVIETYIPTGAANGNSLSEAGLFNAAAGGTLYARTTHGAIAKTEAIAITYEWTLSIGAS